MENSQNDENEKALEASVVENDKASGKNEEVVVEAQENDKNEVVETSAGQQSQADNKFVETVVDANGTVEEPSVASSSGIKKPQGLPAKNRIVKKVKRLVKRKIKKGSGVQVAGEGNDTLEQGIKEDRTIVNTKEDDQSAVPSLGESEKEKKVMDSVAGSPQCSTEKDKDSETSLGVNDMKLEELAEAPQPTDRDEKAIGGESSGKETLKEVKKRKASILKRLKGKKVKGTLAEVMDKKSATILQGPTEGVDVEVIVSDKRHAGASSKGNMMEAEKAIGSSAESPGNALSLEKRLPRKRKAKAKFKKIQAEPLVKSGIDNGTPQLEQNDQDNNMLDGNKQRSDAEKLISLEANTGEGSQQKTLVEKQKETGDKTGLAGDQRSKRKRQRKQVLGSNKRHRKEVVAAADVTQERMEERKGQLVDSGKRERDDHSKERIGGLIFMCNKKTRPDCFRYSVMGVQEKRKDFVMGIKPGLKLFLYDYDLKLLYGIFQASSAGGMKLERNAFDGSFPAQVRFKIFSDCIPLPESQFKKAIKENYNHNNKFKTELTHKQVFKLRKLFRPTPFPTQVTHTQPVSILHDADRKRSDRDRYAPSSSSHQNRTHERRRASPPPRREEQLHNLYLSEREYRTYGLRRGETIQHNPVPPPDSSYHIVYGDRVCLDSYRPSVDHDRLLRQAEIDRHDRREVRHVHLPERDYHMYDHLSFRREIMGRKSPDPPASAVALDSYRRDPYYGYEYHAPERPPRTYPGSPGREDDDLYSRYVTPDSLARYYRSSRRYPSITESELPPSLVASRYYRSSRRYPSITESELPPSLVASRYAYSGSLPYSHR